MESFPLGDQECPYQHPIPGSKEHQFHPDFLENLLKGNPKSLHPKPSRSDKTLQPLNRN